MIISSEGPAIPQALTHRDAAGRTSLALALERKASDEVVQMVCTPEVPINDIIVATIINPIITAITTMRCMLIRSMHAYRAVIAVITCVATTLNTSLAHQGHNVIIIDDGHSVVANSGQKSPR